MPLTHSCDGLIAIWAVAYSVALFAPGRSGAAKQAAEYDRNPPSAQVGAADRGRVRHKASMTIELRNVDDENFASWRTAVRRGFGQHVHPDDIARLRNERAEIDRLVGVFDGDFVVGTGGADSHHLTVPGGAAIPMAGIAYITTAATHRRQGILTRMMGRLHEDARERGDAIAGLWARQTALYGRFCYGLAVKHDDWKIDPLHSCFAHARQPTGQTRFVTEEEAAAAYPSIYDRARAVTPGMVDRTPGRWKYELFDADRVRGGQSALFHVLYEEKGEPLGYTYYRTRRSGDSDMGELNVVSTVAVTDDAHTALWRYLFDIDLIGSVRAFNRPVDDAVWWMLADPRQLRRSRHDAVWLRLIDPERALSARAYSTEGRLVIELHDDSAPWVAGRYELDASPGGAACKLTIAEPDLSMNSRDLSAAFLGGAEFGPMAHAGRIEEHRTGALALADTMFATSQAPWAPHYF